MEFFNQAGKMALGSRLRLLTATVTDDAAKIYTLYDTDFSPKWFPVFFVLSETGAMAVTEIADRVKHTQPSVTKIVKEMTKDGLVRQNLNSKDKRRNVVELTQKGTELAEKLKAPFTDMETALDGIIAEARHNLWEAVAEWEFLLEQKSLLKRVQEQKKIRESKNVRIVEYEPRYRQVFKTMTEEWISAYFVLERTDMEILNNPEEYIINKGGKILVALHGDKPVGVCALIKMDDPEYDYEMAKMSVVPVARGKGIGLLLARAIIKKAKELGASKLYLESNTILKPAINLYYKLGFQKVAGRPSLYERCNIQMELDLSGF